MKIAFIGAGAIGSLFGSLLEKGDIDTLLIGRQNHVNAIRKKGLFVSGIEEFNVKIEASTNPHDAKDSDIIIITTKAYDTRNALLDILPILNNKVTVMSLQNGAGNIEEISKYVDKQNIIGAVTSMGAFLEAPGSLQFKGKGATMIGAISEKNNNAKEIVKIFNSAGIKAEFTDNIKREIWSKVIINSAINSIASIFDCENGILLDENLLELIREVTTEGKIILQKEGINISNNIYENTVNVVKNTSKNINSMLTDIRKGKRTEIDYINGKIIELGNKLDIPTPYNLALFNMIKFKENKIIQKS